MVTGTVTGAVGGNRRAAPPHVCQPLPPGKFVVLRRPGEHADAFHGVGWPRRRYRPACPERIRLPESLRGVEPTPSLPDDTPPGCLN